MSIGERCADNGFPLHLKIDSSMLSFAWAENPCVRGAHRMVAIGAYVRI